MMGKAKIADCSVWGFWRSQPLNFRGSSKTTYLGRPPVSLLWRRAATPKFKVFNKSLPPSMVRIRFSYRALYYQAKLQSGCLAVRTDRAKLPELTVHNRIVPAPSAPDLRSIWARVNGLKTSSSLHGAREMLKTMNWGGDVDVEGC
jgi:hypothetical protein